MKMKTENGIRTLTVHITPEVSRRLTVLLIPLMITDTYRPDGSAMDLTTCISMRTAPTIRINIKQGLP